MICVDASVAAKWVLAEEFSDKASALYRACVDAAVAIVAPPLLAIEVTNIIRQRMRREGMALAEARRLLRRFQTFAVAVHVPGQLYDQALVLAEGYDLAAAYDAHYVALAQILGCDLWTNDQRLLRALGGRLSFVRWIGAYQGGERV